MAHQVNLSWIAPDDASSAATYNIYRASGLCPQTAFTKVASGIAALSFVDSSVQVGKSYCYYGTHVESGFESVPSNTAGGTVLPKTITIQIVVA